ncbi:MAG: WhiB family transcriptional regulator [Aldersonia sp.]|nr:WhiB family transcriptional regulator [Aldersonia sp.]
MTTPVDATARRPLAEPWDWQLQARCRVLGSETFFGPEGEPAVARARRERAAKRICAGCEVRTPCAAWALQFDESDGIWGGMTPNERRRARRFARLAKLTASD